jgi:3D (Asp-Asp-Asp) domain-containing protein
LGGSASATRTLVAAVLAVSLSACAMLGSEPPPEAQPSPGGSWRELEVTATAYNSVAAQTSNHPTLTAFGITLRPGMRIVAVSRDLEGLGLRDGVVLTIVGEDGEWTVGDRMNARWRRKIDLYMGDDVQAARAWGERRVRIRWRDR